jgi:hypothetical protein
MGHVMLSEVLNSLKETKSNLQRQLAQRPEYRALLIIEKAAEQLSQALDPLNPLVATPSENVAPVELNLANLALAPTNSVPAAEQRNACAQEAPVETAAAIADPSHAPSAHIRPEMSDEDSPIPTHGAPEESGKAAPRTIDLFLTSTSQGVASATPPRPRSYLPFVAAPRLVKSSRN